MLKIKQLDELLSAVGQMDSNDVQKLLENYDPSKDSKETLTNESIRQLAMEDLKTLQESAQLDEEFFEKLTTIFESSLSIALKRKQVELQEAADKRVEREIQTRTQELEDLSEQYVQDEIVGKINAYMDYATSRWLKENEVTIEQNIRADLVEGVINGIKNVFEEQQIDLPESTVNELEKVNKKFSTLSESLDQKIDELVEAEKRIETLEKKLFLKEALNDLTDVQKDHVENLLENVSIDDLEEWKGKVKVLKEHVVNSKSEKKTEKLLDESVTTGDEPKIDETMKRYTQFLSR